MMPGIATAFAIGGFSSLGLPATAGFVAEFLTFVGAWASAHPWWLFPGVIGAFLTSIYVLRVVEQIFWGTQERRSAFPAPARRAGHRVGGARYSRRRSSCSSASCRASLLAPIDTATVPLLMRPARSSTRSRDRAMTLDIGAAGAGAGARRPDRARAVPRALPPGRCRIVAWSAG